MFAAAGMPGRLKAAAALFPTVTKPRAEQPAAALQVPGLILAEPGDPMSLRSNAVELARAWKRGDAAHGQQGQGRRAGRGPPAGQGGRAARRRPRHAEDGARAVTGYLLHMLTGDKAYRDFADPEVALPKAPAMTRSPTIRSPSRTRSSRC